MSTPPAPRRGTPSVGTRRPWFPTPDTLSLTVLGGGFLFIAVVATTGVRGLTPDHLIALVALVVLYGLAFRTVFQHVGRTRTLHSTVPTEPALVGMLFLLPLGLVPLAVLLAQLAGDPKLGRTPREIVRTLAIRALNGWHCLGPVLVLSLAGVRTPDPAHWRVYLLALAAQFAFDLGSGAVRAAALGDGVVPILRPMAWTFGIDAALAVIGLCAVATGQNLAATLVLVAVPIGLVALLAGDRRELAHSTVRLDREASDAREEARVDALTGLGNRRAWSEAVAAAEEALRADDRLRADVVVADVDGLKEANDSRGHECGDELIRATAAAARAAAPPGTTVCRTGGDEFALLRVVTRTAPPVEELVRAVRAAVVTRGPVAGGIFSVAVAGASCPDLPTIGEAFRVGDAAVNADKRARRIVRAGTPPVSVTQVPPPREANRPSADRVPDRAVTP